MASPTYVGNMPADSGDIYTQFLQALGGDANQGLPDQFVQQFYTTYKNLTGQDPGTEDLKNFIQASIPTAGLPGTPTYSDISNLSNNYVQNTFSPQIAKYQQQQQQNQLQSTQQTIQDLISKQTAATAQDLTNPNSPTYQSFSGLMNNMGISPSSGAFQAGLGSTLGQNASSAINAALGGVSLPAISGIQGMSNFPLQVASQNSDLSHLNQLSDFGLQASLAKYLAEASQPSGAEKMIGMAAGAGQAAQGLGMGIGGASQATSYVCKELIKRDLICESDMDDFHVHIMPAMFKKGRAFWKYAVDGWKLVEAANRVEIDWEKYKPLLFDRVMQEPDACAAVDLYAEACYAIASACDPRLWDPKVYRTSFLDSLPYIPRLLTYRPFIQALWKCLRIKLLFIFDNPHCEVHRGA